MSIFHVIVARIRAFLRPGDLDRDFEQELEAHLAMAEEEKIRGGMTVREARRQARLELGGVAQLREAGRAARGLPWLDTSLLDLKLGLRMLRKSWGLTLVGGLAITITIGLGAAIFAAIDTVARSSLPFPEGERIVAIQPWDPELGQDHNASIQDFLRWRRELDLVEEIGAFRTVQSRDSLGARVFIAQMTAAAFGLPRVQPLLGRAFLQDDELAAAEPVVILGYDLWQSRFSADPQVVGERLLLDNTLHTVIGVMPEGFAFPVNHLLWTPLRASQPVRTTEEDISVFVLARLAPGVALEGARSEVAALGLLPVGSAEKGREWQTRVVPYASTFNDDIRNSRWLIRVILILVALLLVPPCANIAILLFARNLRRQEEFAARYVLGASRGRIVVQLLVEALLLAVLAGGAGLLLARQLLWRLQGVVEQQLSGAIPFWMDFSLSLKTLGFVAGLAFFAALLAGGIPAWRATGRLRQSAHHALGSRSGGLRLGRTWTALVVAQVILSMAALPTAVEMSWRIFRPALLGPGFAAEEFLTARVGLDSVPNSNVSAKSDPALLRTRFGDLKQELVRRLREDPTVSGVTASRWVPGEEPFAYLEVESLDGPQREPVQVADNEVDQGFFTVFEIPILTGRAFQPGDFALESRSIIVNRYFAEELARGGKVVGRRLRYVKRNGAAAATSWHVIVGVTEDLPKHKDRRRIYRPLPPGLEFPLSLSLHIESTAPGTLAARLNELPGQLDPALRIDRLRYIGEIYQEQEVNNHLVGYALASMMSCVLLFSLAGIYTLMSFTVAHRRREIGIRSALGAQPWRLVASILSRAMLPVSLGAVGGSLIAMLIKFYLTSSLVGARDGHLAGLIPATETLLILVGLLAALGPARRALRVDPTDVLREG